MHRWHRGRAAVWRGSVQQRCATRQLCHRDTVTDNLLEPPWSLISSSPAWVMQPTNDDSKAQFDLVYMHYAIGTWCGRHSFAKRTKDVARGPGPGSPGADKQVVEMDILCFSWGSRKMYFVYTTKHSLRGFVAHLPLATAEEMQSHWPGRGGVDPKNERQSDATPKPCSLKTS